MENTPLSSVERKIERTTERHGCSEQGKIWMENCLDPFPDIPRKSEGYPDMVTGPSVVQKIKMSTTIRCPAALAGGNWDCVIKTDHFENSIGFVLYNNVSDLNPTNNPTFDVGSLDDTAMQRGGLNIYATQTGTSLTSGKIIGNLAPAQTYFNDGRTRVIAKGFEVTNTTSQLYKQGAVSVYRCPNQSVERNGMFLGVQSAQRRNKMLTIKTPNGKETFQFGQRDHESSSREYKESVTGPEVIDHVIYGNVNGLLTADSPSTYDSIQRFEDTRTWEAALGSYSVATMSSPINRPLDQISGLVPMSYDVPLLPKWWVPSHILNNDGTSFVLQEGQNLAYPSVYNESGAWYTGLSPQTSLTVVYHVLLERFVNENALDLVVMTTKSSAYDPCALEMYAKAATVLPTGVEVGENADGDWIKTVADVLGGLGVPGMGIVKAGVDLWNTGKATVQPIKVNQQQARKRLGGGNQQQERQIKNVERQVKQVKKKEKVLARRPNQFGPFRGGYAHPKPQPKKRKKGKFEGMPGLH